MSTSIYLKRDIENVLRGTAYASGVPEDLQRSGCGKAYCEALARAYTRGVQDTLAKIAMCFGVWPGEEGAAKREQL